MTKLKYSQANRLVDIFMDEKRLSIDIDNIIYIGKFIDWLYDGKYVIAEEDDNGYE